MLAQSVDAWDSQAGARASTRIDAWQCLPKRLTLGTVNPDWLHGEMSKVVAMLAQTVDTWDLVTSVTPPTWKGVARFAQTADALGRIDHSDALGLQRSMA